MNDAAIIERARKKRDRKQTLRLYYLMSREIRKLNPFASWKKSEDDANRARAHRIFIVWPHQEKIPAE